jgi:uncharacterized protein YbjT (DUF2867 family)
MADKTIVVFGATGAQGGGLVHSILEDPDGEFSVRAVTRNPSSDSAKALADKGAEIVKANIDNYEDIKKALNGAYGAFFVTVFWEHFSSVKEFNNIKNYAKAASEEGLEHVIWSTLEDTREVIPLDSDEMPTLQEKYNVPHFDAKGEADKFFEEYNVPTTYLLASFYWDNMIHFGMGPKRGEDGNLAIAFPMGNKKMAGIAADDIGKCAFGIFKQGKEMVGERIGIAGEHISFIHVAKSLSDFIGEKVTYHAVTPEQYRGFGFPGSDDLGNMFLSRL